MADLCAPIPDVSVTSKSVQIEDLEFSSDHRISHSHEGVGSGEDTLLHYVIIILAQLLKAFLAEKSHESGLYLFFFYILYLQF